MTPSATRTRIGIATAALLLGANMLVPLFWGDVYPFTSAPMFRDSPRQFCNYHVYSADGQELNPPNWLVQRIYDGNPVGYGVGVRPPTVLEQKFGVIHDEATVRRHFEEQLVQPHNRAYDAVEVVQEVIGPIDTQHVGVVRTATWKISR